VLVCNIAAALDVIDIAFVARDRPDSLTLSYEARELKLAYRHLVLMPKKLPRVFLKFCPGAEIHGGLLVEGSAHLLNYVRRNNHY